MRIRLRVVGIFMVSRKGLFRSTVRSGRLIPPSVSATAASSSVSLACII